MNTYSRSILITGGNGQLASALKKQSSQANADVVFCSREEMDITSIASIENAILHHMPSIVVNTAAYTAVDKAESEQEAALLINSYGAKLLAIVCEAHDIPLIHISTDYVFDGNQQTPYNEYDIASPNSIYGESKWRGEKEVRENCRNHIILRVSGVFSEFGNNFLKTMLKLAQERKELRIVDDQITCPTYAGDIADAIYTIAKNPQYFGTYHYCSKPPVSWYGFAKDIIDTAKLEKNLMVEKIDAITTAEYPTPAKRPAFSVLDCTLIKDDYGILQPEWKNAVKTIVPQLIK